MRGCRGRPPLMPRCSSVRPPVCCGWMARVFVSYRRSDTTAIARQVSEVLRQRLREDGVFLDLDAIIPGQRFDAVIAERLRQADVVLVLVGCRGVTAGRNRRGRHRSGPPRLAGKLLQVA